DMRVVAALLPFEVDFRIAAAARAGWWRTILGDKALVRSPSANQRAIDAEMFVRQQLRFFRLLHHLSEQSAHDVVLDQPIAILRVGTVIPRGFLHAQSDE